MTPWSRLRRHSWPVLWLPLVVWMGVIFVFSAQPHLPQLRLGPLDKLPGFGGHLLEYAILAALWTRALGGRRHALFLAFVLAMVYALSDEFHQYFVPGRHADPRDLLVDAFGAMLGLWAWGRWQRRLAGRPQRQPADRP